MQTKKNSCTVYTLIDPFPANRYSSFPKGTPFYALSILTIFLDMSHEKRRKYKHFNESKTFLFEKNFWGGKKLNIYLKTMFLKKKIKKLIFLKKKLSFKNLFF